jgi:hypothetical protein
MKRWVLTKMVLFLTQKVKKKKDRLDDASSGTVHLLRQFFTQKLIGWSPFQGI